VSANDDVEAVNLGCYLEVLFITRVSDCDEDVDAGLPLELVCLGLKGLDLAKKLDIARARQILL
jgi:hypothetical protein